MSDYDRYMHREVVDDFADEPTTVSVIIGTVTHRGHIPVPATFGPPDFEGGITVYKLEEEKVSMDRHELHQTTHSLFVLGRRQLQELKAIGILVIPPTRVCEQITFELLGEEEP